MTAMTWYALAAVSVFLTLPVAFYVLRVASKKKPVVPMPVIRPTFEEQPPRQPAMFVEVVDGGYLLGPRIFCRELPDGFAQATGAFPAKSMIQGRPHIYVRTCASWTAGKFPEGVHRYVGSVPAPDGWWRVFAGKNGDAEGEAL